MYECCYGNGSKRILIIPGWMHTTTVYEDFMLRLATLYTVTAVDLPGFGGSMDVELTGANLTEGVVRYVREYLEARHFDLIISHSFSGAVLLRALSEMTVAPCSKVIFASPTYLGSERMRSLARKQILTKGLFKLQNKVPRLISDTIAGAAAGQTLGSDVDRSILIEESRRKNSEIASKLFAEVCEDTWRFTGSLPGDIEAHILAGGKDKIVTYENLETLRDDLCGCSLVTIDGIGHTTILEAPVFLYDYVVELLK